MAYETVLKIKKASFQVGEKPIKSIINGKAEQDEDFM
jgi:hypothetical protein